MTGAGTKNFDPAVRAAAVETYVKGESAERVAALFGCSKPAVLKWVRAAGVPVRNRRGPRRPSVAVPRRAEVAPPPAPPPPPPAPCSAAPAAAPGHPPPAQVQRGDGHARARALRGRRVGRGDRPRPRLQPDDRA